MKKTAALHKAGDIVEMAGIKFVVLDPHMATDSEEEEALFILAVDTVGNSVFGDSNNYAESDLKKAAEGWLDELAQKGLDLGLVKTRTLDLTTLDGYTGYGTLETKAAPLTMDEARKYADLIPECDEWSWLATGWGRPGNVGSAFAFVVRTNGDWYHNYCSSSYGIRPALVVSSSLFASEESDLSGVSTDDLLEEIRRRIGA